jgi:hypothetical protein
MGPLLVSARPARLHTVARSARGMTAGGGYAIAELARTIHTTAGRNED